jgi:hypothetical protein
VATFAELPLSRRVRAAITVITEQPTLTIEQRGELVALAVWPSNAILPGEVSPRRRDATAEERATAVQFAEQGYTEREIAERLGRPRTTVRQWLRTARL